MKNLTFHLISWNLFSAVLLITLRRRWAIKILEQSLWWEKKKTRFRSHHLPVLSLVLCVHILPFRIFMTVCLRKKRLCVQEYKWGNSRWLPSLLRVWVQVVPHNLAVVCHSCLQALSMAKLNTSLTNKASRLTNCILSSFCGVGRWLYFTEGIRRSL